MKSAWGIALLVLSGVCFAAQPDRLTAPINSSEMVVLAGNVHGRAQAQYDQGPVDPAMQLHYVTMQMQPSPAQQAALTRLLAEQQDPKSPNYHRWLTPEQYADTFGLSPNDVSNVESWLQSQGFMIEQTARGRDWIAFSGTAGMVEKTFNTKMHHFLVGGETHYANATPLSIPKALNGVVIGFDGLHDFSLKPMSIGRILGSGAIYPMIAHPFFNLGGANFLAPGDIATIYDITPLYTAGITGNGLKMVIVGQVDMSSHFSDIDDFRSAFGLAKNDPVQTIVGGTNPGTDSGDLGESELDLEWSGAVARSASILFITAAISNNGVFGAAKYAVDNKLAPVLSMSYGGCESENAGFIPGNEIDPMQKASAEGITFVASSGDEGAAGCDDGSESAATKGLAVVYPASSPEVTGAGGTEFNEGNGSYWTGDNPNGGTAISYIPEEGWNDTTINGTLSATGGGASSCGESNGNTCTGGFPKPSWQTGTGVPKDGVRDVPDIAMASSADHDGFIFCSEGSCANGIGSNPLIVGGTSAAAPVFAGIITLVNQFVGGTGLGNVNTKLYQLAQTGSNGVFHDVKTGNNIVPCAQDTPNCPIKAPFQFGYNSGTGYDQVTGLGSVDATNLASNFGATSKTTTTVTSSLNPAQQGASVTFTAAVSGSATHPPTGTVTFNDGRTQLGVEALVSGSAPFATFTLTVGSHSITGVYGGDLYNAPSTSTVLTETIQTPTGLPTSIVPTGNPNPSNFGSSVTFTATVTATGASAPTGTVSFDDGSTPLATVNVTNVNVSTGMATYTTSKLSGGHHPITMVYNGDANNAPSNIPWGQNVNRATTTTTLSSSANTIFSGASVTLTATVKPSTSTPATGAVTFNDGSNALGTGALNSSGVATLITTGITAAGANSITAVYGGDTNYQTSTSTAVNVTANPATFSFSASPSSQSISATNGDLASYQLTITPSGSYTSQVNFSCTFSPASAAACIASPSPVVPGGNVTQVTLTISGAQPAIVFRAARTMRQTLPLYVSFTPVGLMGLVLLAGRKKSMAKSARAILLTFALAVMAASLFGCGGGSSGPSSQSQQTAQTYQVTITASAPANATSAAVNATKVVSLTVNP